MTRETSAGVVLFTAGPPRRFLLLHYPSGHWDFVKGRIESGESARQAAVRETAEETGITDIRFVGGFERQIAYTFQRGGRAVRKRVIFYLAETKNVEVRISHEHLDYIWMSHADAMRRVTFGNARRILADAQRHISGASA